MVPVCSKYTEVCGLHQLLYQKYMEHQSRLFSKIFNLIKTLCLNVTIGDFAVHFILVIILSKLYKRVLSTEAIQDRKEKCKYNKLTIILTVWSKKHSK